MDLSEAKMSDVKQAIGTLKSRSKFVADINLYAIIAYKLGIEALEKQIPRTPIETQGLLDIEYMCPICGYTVDIKDRYCWNCGQKLKYEEELCTKSTIL